MEGPLPEAGGEDMEVLDEAIGDNIYSGWMCINGYGI
jgi:hypothetical protein